MKKVGWYLMSVLPMIAMLAIQTICAVVASIIYMARYGVEIGIQIYMEEIMQLMVITQIITLIFTGLWYFFVVLRKNMSSELEEAKKLSWKSVLIILCLAVSLQGLIHICLTVWQYVAPAQIEAYNRMMEESGIGTLTVFSVIATVIMAPLGEEIVFRGITVEYLQRAKAPIGVMIFVQALLFGIMHLNLVQGTYAFFMGLISGYLLLTYKTIVAPMLFHAFLNSYSTFGSSLLEKLDPTIYLVACVIVGILFFPFGIWMLKKDTKKDMSHLLAE